MGLEIERKSEKRKERGCEVKEKVVRDGMIDITTGRRLGKKKIVMEKKDENLKTLWQKIMDWLNTPIGGNH